MNEITCSGCGLRVAASRTTCPICGTPTRQDQPPPVDMVELARQYREIPRPGDPKEIPFKRQPMDDLPWACCLLPFVIILALGFLALVLFIVS